MLRNHWRRFRGKSRRTQSVDVLEPVPTNDITNRMRRQLDDALQQGYGPHWRTPRVEQLGSAIQLQQKRVNENEHDAAALFALLVLRGPLATRAQEQMDKHPQGFRNKEARVLELIDFNDAFVSTVLALREEERVGFVQQMQHEIAQFCKQVGARMFSDEQWDAITRGLSREIAVYLGAIKEGFHVRMTSRREDAMGVDMVIMDRDSGRSLNVDVKTPSSYRYRLQDLVREGRMSEQAAAQADIDGYAKEINGHGDDAVRVTLMRVDPNEVGDIEGFEFVRPDMLARQLRELFAG